MMVEIQLPLILTACIVYFGLTLVQTHNQLADQAVTNDIIEESEIRDKFQNLLNSIAKKDGRRSQIYREILKQEVEKNRQTFDAIQEELQFARNRHVNKKRNFFQKSNVDKNFVAAKREIKVNTGAQHPTNSTNSTAVAVAAAESNSSLDERRFGTPITPLITDVKNQTKAMHKLKDLWVKQQKHFEEVKNRTQELCTKTKQPIEPIRFLFDEIDPLLVRQVRVLTTLPWENTDEMHETVDYELLDQQQRSWDALGRCLTDHFEFPENQQEELNLRKCFKKAKDDLLKRKEDLLRIVKVNFTMWEAPYTESEE